MSLGRSPLDRTVFVAQLLSCGSPTVCIRLPPLAERARRPKRLTLISGNPPYSISPYPPARRHRTEFICNPDRAPRGPTRFDVGCIDRQPRGAAGLYSGNTWPSLAMVVVPEKFFLISPSHSESGRSGGA